MNILRSNGNQIRSAYEIFLKALIIFCEKPLTLPACFLLLKKQYHAINKNFYFYYFTVQNF